MATEDASRAGQRLTISGVEVIASRNVLVGASGEIRLEPRVMDLLIALGAAPGEVFSREALINQVWQVRHGGDESLSRAVSLLRQAFRQAGVEGAVIETAARRGYRLVGEVTRTDRARLSGDGDAEPVVLKPAFDESLRVPAPASARPSTPRLMVGAGAGAVALIALIALAPWRESRQAPAQANPVVALSVLPAPAQTQKYESIAVLPFLDLSETKDKQTIADGIAEELLSILAGIEGLSVAARTSSFLLRDSDKPVDEIGRILNVETVLEGSVRADAGTLRITVQLIDARTGFHLWSESYNREQKDLLALQAEIATGIAARLNLALEGQDAVKLPTLVPGAYAAFQEGQALSSRTTTQSLAKARSAFERAIELDPNFADAYAMLANVYLQSSIRTYGDMEPEETFRFAEANIAKAKALAPGLARAHVIESVLHTRRGDEAAAEMSLKKAIGMAPNAIGPRLNLAYTYMWQGRYGESGPLLDAVRRLDPLSSGVADAYVKNLAFTGRAAEAAAEAEKVLEYSPSANFLRIAHSFALAEARQHEAMLRELVKMFENDPNDIVTRMRLAPALAFNGAPAEAALVGKDARSKAIAFALDGVAFDPRKLLASGEGKPLDAREVAEVFIAAKDLAGAKPHLESVVIEEGYDFLFRYGLLAHLAAARRLSGDEQGARKAIAVAETEIARRRDHGGKSDWLAYRSAMTAAVKGDRDAALAAIEALAEASAFSANDPLFENLKHEPRFRAAIEKQRAMRSRLRTHANEQGLHARVRRAAAASNQSASE